MAETTQDRIRQEQAESFGRLMAGFSHDMKNHLGVIRESNGLIGDLLSMADLHGNEQLAQRVTKAVGSIERRVETAAQMLHFLSSFAHRSDTPKSFVNVNDLIREECVFLDRFSRLRQISLVIEPAPDLAPRNLEVALLQHVFYRLFMAAIGLLEAGESLTIVSNQQDKFTGITFLLQGKTQDIPAGIVSGGLQAALEKLNASVETVSRHGENSRINLILSNS
jgi:K+-sensing histidine kinase KdpD